jgi:hypothetical protein
MDSQSINNEPRPVKLFFFIICVICSVFYIILFFSSNSKEENILLGKLQYSKKYGWINWAHANPSSAIQLINQIHKKNNLAKEKFTIEYSQFMKLPFTSTNKFIAECKTQYLVDLSKSKQEENEAALVIFMRTSELFEEMQGSFPFFLFPPCNQSSFENGDLTGNLISFYLASNNLSMTDFKKNADTVTKEQSYKLINEFQLEKNRSWFPYLFKRQENTRSSIDSLVSIAKTYKIRTKLLKTETKYYFE